jgi:Amidohydrolase family
MKVPVFCCFVFHELKYAFYTIVSVNNKLNFNFNRIIKSLVNLYNAFKIFDMKKFSLLSICICFMFLSNAQDSTSYSIYHNIRKSGFIKINRMADGWNSIRYAYVDRGRRMNVHFTIKTNNSGAMEQFNADAVRSKGDSSLVKALSNGKIFKQIIGNDTIIKDFKSIVLDRYKNSGINEFIFPALLDSALHGGQVYQMQKELNQTFLQNGITIKAELWGLYLKTNPQPISLVWYYPNHRMMAQFQLWGYTIEEQAAPLKDQLKKINDSVFYAKGEQIAQLICSKSIQNFALYNCNVVDIEKGVLIKNQTVIVGNNKIEKIGDTLAIKVPKGYTIINTTNKTVMPGLWDMHKHMVPGFGYADLQNGTTNARDLGNSVDIEILKQKTNQGLLVGPRIIWMCGFIDNLEELAGPCGILINTLEDGIKAVHYYKKAGYQSIKLYSSIKPEFVKPLAAEAHKLGMKVSGHIPAFTTAVEAIQNGYDEINHLYQALLGFYGNKFDNRVGRSIIMSTMGFKISPYSAYGQQLIQIMKERNTVMEPTSLLLTNALPKKLLTANDSAISNSVDTVYAWLKVLVQNGIRLMPGTDGEVSAGIIPELKNYIKAGVSNAEALRMATINAATYSGWDKQLGTVTKGKLADLIVLDEDPLLSINALEKINMVIANGKLFYVKDLKALSALPGTNPSGSIDDDD